MEGLNERQRRFIELYTTGPEGVRGNATASYYSAAYHPRAQRTAEVNASRLLRNAEVKLEMQRIYRKRDAEIIAKMEDWKLKAPAAQRRLLLLAVGLLPQSNEQGGMTSRVIESGADRNLTLFLKDTNMDIIKLAYPARIYETLEHIEDPLDEIAKLIGVLREDMPSIDDLPGYGNGEVY